MQARDYQGLKDHLDPYLETIIRSLLPNGKLVGQRWMCPGGVDGDGKGDFHFGHKLWRDWKGEEKACSVVDLWMQVHACSKELAYDELAGQFEFQTGREAPEAPPRPTIGKRTKAPPAVPVPPEYGLPDLDRANSWVYRDAEGRVLFYVQRADRADGTKALYPWRWNGEQRKWVKAGWPPPRPLYNLPAIVNNPEAAIVLVEGEKTAEAGIRLNPPRSSVVVVTWPGGCKAVSQVDWSPLRGRRVALVPDNDQAGVQAMAWISKTLIDLDCEVVLNHPHDQEPGWDIADRQWSSWRELVDFLRTYRSHPEPSPVASLPPPPPSMAARMKPALTVVEGGQSSGNAALADPAPAPASRIWHEMGLDLNLRGNPHINEANILRIYESIPEIGEHIWWDTFYQDELTDWNGDLRALDEDDFTNLTAFMQASLGIPSMKRQIVRDATLAWCRRRANQRDEPADWLRSLEWDGKARIDSFLGRLLGVEVSPYSISVSRNLWLSLVARLTRPGCKQDYMCILEGLQGDRKSTAWELIGSPLGEGRSWYCETKSKVGTTDFWMAMEGIAILNMDELDSLNGVAQTQLKSALSCKVDRYRAKYGRKPKNVKRRCVWVGTTNADEYLLDVTGGRRYWPVKVEKVDMRGIVEEREQCYAEAFARVDGGEPWHKIDTVIAEAEQESRRESDAWEDPIAKYLLDKIEVLVTEVAKDAIDLEMARITVREQRRIGRCLRVLGWERHTTRRDGRQVKIWRSPNAEPLDRGNPQLGLDDVEDF